MAYLQKRLRELQLVEEGNAQVALTHVQCFDICQRGPILLIQPEGTWYMSCTPEAIERILQNHIINGKPVRDLILATSNRKK